jgi:hypothetical protein
MNWKCNIDRRGRYLRGFIGVLMLAGGVYLVGWSDHAFWGCGAIAGGAFAIFEAIKGWCAVRAMGIDTPF